MKKIEFFLLAIIAFGYTYGQCKDIRYNFPNTKCYTQGDSIIFSVKNYCKINKSVIFSMEYKDSTNDWQEIDGDIFLHAAKGMKIIKLVSMKSQKFSFKINDIDSAFSKQNKKINFRIVANLYSDDKIEIIETKAVKYIFVIYEKLID